MKASFDFLRKRFVDYKLDFGLVLGSGLGKLTEQTKVIDRIAYAEIPEFPVSTVIGHKGEFVVSQIGSRKGLIQNGRFHYYEGLEMTQLALPIRLMAKLGVNQLYLTNATGGVNEEYQIGDIMIITDHINLLPTNPLIGPNDDELGPRFPDMSMAYSPRLIKKALSIAESMNVSVQTGVYSCVTGPCFETPAEYKYLRLIGADAVGMSIVPEVIAARHAGMECFGASVITDLCTPGQNEEDSHENVLEVAAKTGKILGKILLKMIETNS
jgi:purine-nucleoside phosphorylase